MVSPFRETTGRSVEGEHRGYARRWWEAEYTRTPATELRRFHILSGAIFPIYYKIMGSAGVHNVKIARATLLYGCALVGLSLTQAASRDWHTARRSLAGGGPQLAGRKFVIGLDNGWQLTSRIAGDQAFEVVLNGVPSNRVELDGYGLSDGIISYKERWFSLMPEAA